MTREEIDVLWQQAAEEAFDKGETNRRYEFANLILDQCIEIADKAYATDDVLEAIRSMKV